MIDLTGYFFVADHEDHYHTGEILGQVAKTIWLARYDATTQDAPDVDAELFPLHLMLDDWRFFRTRAALESYLAWMNTPMREPEIIKLVKAQKPEPTPEPIVEDE